MALPQAAENDATENQLMAIFGWENPKQAAEYTKKARRKKLAQNAMHLLIPDQDGNEFVSPFVPLCLTGKKDKGKQ